MKFHDCAVLLYETNHHDVDGIPPVPYEKILFETVVPVYNFGTGMAQPCLGSGAHFERGEETGELGCKVNRDF